MKIGIVCYPTFGGSGVVATELGKALSETGNIVHFISYAQPARLNVFSDNLFYHEVSVKNYPLFHFPPYETSLTSKLVEIVKFEKLDLLHVHYAIPHASSALLAKDILLTMGIKIPVITTLHGTDITLVGSHPFYKPAVTFSINKSDAVTSVSQSLKDDTLRLFDIKNEIDVVPNFIDFSRHKTHFTDCQRDIMANENEKIITHISNFRKVKQIPDVIKVFYNIQKQIPAKLMMVGEGPERVEAEQLCESLGITDKVVFFGNSNEIDKILCFSDLFLLPSVTESFGLAALEAMASGVPVISSNTGGIPEVNIDGVSGFLSNVNDVEDMSKNAIHILSDTNRLKEFKERAKEESKKFDISNIVPKYEAIYKRTLKKCMILK